MTKTASVHIPEPVLDADEIQGNIVPGFNKPHQTYIGLRIDDVAAARKFLRLLAGEISSMATVMRDRLEFRRLRDAIGEDRLTAGDKRSLAQRRDQLHINVSFSYEGLRKLTPEAQSFQSDAFRQGLIERSPMLGDPTSSDDPGSPRNWVVGSPGKVPDMLVIIASDVVPRGQERVAQMLKDTESFGLSVLYKETGSVLPGDLHGHEQFGFHDNVSQPGVRGKVQLPEGEMYVQPRAIASSEVPDHLLYGYPGQDLVWPGEFILGYPTQTPDPLVRGPIESPQPPWAKNGSFVVFRRLRQDVQLFWDVMAKEAERLAKQPGFSNMTQVRLAAMLVGRWPSGAPFARVPEGDNPALGNDSLANNHFRYDAPTCPVTLARGHKDEYPNAKADPIGLVCPMAAHIRKVNTRDSANDDGGTVGTYVRRIIRRGLPFGAPLVRSIGPDGVELDPVDREGQSRAAVHRRGRLHRGSVRVPPQPLDEQPRRAAQPQRRRRVHRPQRQRRPGARPRGHPLRLRPASRQGRHERPVDRPHRRRLLLHPLHLRHPRRPRRRLTLSGQAYSSETVSSSL
ncbi:MAG: hypothetical protein R3B70_08720 [Polyangiaceae bacterium]